MRRRAYLFFLLIASSNFSLAKDSNTNIPTVFVSSPKKNFLTSASGPKTIINQEQISTTGVTTLSETLQNLGGVQLQDIIGNGSQISLGMRGFGANASSNTLFLINGIPITNPDMSPPDINIIPVNNIEFIEIIAGSESVLYGDQAVGGVINVITNMRVKKSAELICKAGSYHLRDCLIALSQHKSKFDFNISVEDNHTNNYRDNNESINHTLLGNINYHYTQGYVKFDYNLAYENMEYPGALTALQVKQNRRQAVNDINFFKNNNGFLHLQQKQILNSDWNSLIDLAYRQMNGNGILSSPFTQYRNSTFVKPQLNGKIKNTNLTLGVDFQSDHYLLNSLFGDTNDNLQKYSVFGLATILLNPKLNISLGARGAQQHNKLISYTNNFSINRAIATTLGATYLFSPQTKFYLRRAESYRFPKADENATAPIGVNGLRTQRGTAYEAGAEIIKNKYRGKIDLFALYLRDEISFDPFQTPQQPFGSNINLDPTVRYGITLSGKYKIHSHVNLDAQYIFVNARFQTGIYAGNRIPLVSENIFRTGLDWNFIKHWNFYTEMIYFGNQFSENDNANIAGEIGGYTTFNFNLRYTYSHFSAALHANNIFNKYYYFYTVYQPSMSSQFFYPAPGRNFILTLNYNFM